ncbi:MAG: hypothetical protein ABEK17_01405 [Candidatus Aenigmatarchaeota archaeon]
MKNKKIAFFTITIALVVLVAGCTSQNEIENNGKTTTTENEAPEEDTNNPTEDEGETTTEVKSIDVTYKGFESGKLGSEVRVRAREFNNDRSEWRVDGQDEDGTGVYIYNNDESSLYFKDTGEDKWTKVTGSYVDQMGYNQFHGYTEFAREQALEKGSGTFTVTYQGQTQLEVTVNEINPALPDDIFTPPEGATVEEFSFDYNV